MKTEPIFYTVDLKHLLSIQKEQTEKNIADKERERLEFLDRKKRLLKIVLPLVHGIVALHNNKCILSTDSTTGRKGLLGYTKVDLEKKLDSYVNRDYHFSSCGGTVEIDTGIARIKVWLHDSKSSNFIATPSLGYSMTTSKEEEEYGRGVEDELIYLAKYCARYTDDWNNN